MEEGIRKKYNLFNDKRKILEAKKAEEDDLESLSELISNGEQQ